MTSFAYQDAADYYDGVLSSAFKQAYFRRTKNTIAVDESLLRSLKVFARLCFQENWAETMRFTLKFHEGFDAERIRHVNEARKDLANTIAPICAGSVPRPIPSNAVKLIADIMEASTPDRKNARSSTLTKHLEEATNAGFFNEVKGKGKNSVRVFHPTEIFHELIQLANSQEGFKMKDLLDKHFNSENGPDAAIVKQKRAGFEIERSSSGISLAAAPNNLSRFSTTVFFTITIILFLAQSAYASCTNYCTQNTFIFDEPSWENPSFPHIYQPPMQYSEKFMRNGTDFSYQEQFVPDHPNYAGNPYSFVDSQDRNDFNSMYLSDHSTTSFDNDLWNSLGAIADASDATGLLGAKIQKVPPLPPIPLGE